MPKKLIEVALPLDDINREAAREKSIRHGHPSTLHLWWARRPLAACRAVLFGQLVDDPSEHPEQFPTEELVEKERERLFDIIRDLVKWESSNDEVILERARAEIRRCYPDGPPPIVDPFCGGGSIPLEAQRLGLEAHASDLNPVAVLITKALIELPPKFADRPPVHPADGTRLKGTQTWKGAQGLAEDVRWYGQWMRDRAEERIGHLYPKATLPDGTEATVIAWLWARTVTCPNPACRSTMPLVRSFWLGKKKGKEAWVDAQPDPANKRVVFGIGHGPKGPKVEGTVQRTGAVCLVCDTPVPLEYVRSEGRFGRIGAQLMAIAAEGKRQRMYLPPAPDHEAVARLTRPADVPDTELFDWPGRINVVRYGLTKHADLFTPRQLTTLCMLSDLASEARAEVLRHSDGDEQYSDAVATYLAFGISKLADLGNALCRWEPNAQCPRQLFARQAIPMVWDFAEGNVFSSSSGSWSVLMENHTRSFQGGLFNFKRARSASVVQADATTRRFDGLVISTDPPYYDNIGYADLADFFYVWLRQSLRTIHPELLMTVLTPKAPELVATPYRFNGDKRAAEKHFEDGFSNVFRHASDQGGHEAPMTIFYAFKQSEADDDGDSGTAVSSTGWETMLEGLIQNRLVITGTWPMRTEMGSRMIGQGTNALASSIVLVCRRRDESAGVTDRRKFLQQLQSELADALRNLQTGGIAPVDLAQAAIGPGMAVFSRYAKVVEPDGSAMTVRTALQLINQVLDEVTAEQEGEFDTETRWAVTWYSEVGMDEGAFGRADDLARAKNVSVDGLVKAGLVHSKVGKVRLLERDELPEDWDPTTDDRLTVWEVTQHLVRSLLRSEAEAAVLLAKVGGLADAARDLSYRLFQIAESKRWSKEAGPYNALAAAWPELQRKAAAGPVGQMVLGEGRLDESTLG